MFKSISKSVFPVLTFLILTCCLALANSIHVTKPSSNDSLVSKHSTLHITEKFQPLEMSPVFGEKNTELEARACPFCSGVQCTGVSGTIFEPLVITKVIIAVFLGTIVFFALLFFYKLWSFVDLPYETSQYFAPGSQSSSKPYGQVRADADPILSLTKSVLQGVEKVY